MGVIGTSLRFDELQSKYHEIPNRDELKGKAESQRCVKGEDLGRSREWWGEVLGGECSGLRLMLLLHVGTHSAGPQTLLTLACRNILLLELKAHGKIFLC